MKTILSYFFQTLLPPKVTFTSSENVFFNESFIFRLVETHFLSSGNSMLYSMFGAFFCCWKPWLKLGGTNFNRKCFPASENHFRFFCQKKQFFRIAGTYFSTNASFRVVEIDFLASRNHKLFSRLVETYFLTNPSF